MDHPRPSRAGRLSPKARSQSGFIISASPLAMREAFSRVLFRRRAALPSLKGRSQSGFIMALLMVFIVIMGIMLMKAQPYAIAQVQRDREAELIFRGEAIARAIRIYQSRTGAYPNRLDALAELRPRILRRVYKDPMKNDGEWRLIFAVQPGASGNTSGLPIIGVASQSDASGYRKYKGKELYNEWIFSATDAVFGVPQGMGVGGPPIGPLGGGKDGGPGGGPPPAPGDKK